MLSGGIFISYILAGISTAISSELVATTVHLYAIVLTDAPFARLIIAIHVTVGIAISY